MSWQEPLLTPEATPWESAVEATSASRWPLAWDLIRNLHNPDAIAEDKLPILAWALSVDLWDSAWSVEKKRSVVRQSIADHSLKGTIAGVRRYLEIEEARLVQYLAPPQRAFASRTLTKAEYDAWLAQMPQLRIYLQSRPGDGTGLGFADDGFAFDAFAALDEADLIYGRFPVLYQNGVITPLRTATIVTTLETREAVTVERIALPGIGGLSFANADFAGAAFVEHTVKPAQLYTVALDQSYVHDVSTLAVNTATPGLAPINIRFQRESEIGNAGPALHVGDFASPEFFVRPDEGAWMLYDLIYLLDPAIAAPMVDALSFVNHSRISMTPFTVEMMIDGKTTGANAAVFEGGFVGSAYALPEDLEKVERTMDAVAISKGYRDKALVTFETTRPRTWSDGLPLDGSVPIWSRVPATL